MKRIDYTKPGGLPFSQDFLKFMDDKTNDIQSILVNTFVEGLQAFITVVYGCVLTPGATNYQLSAGAIAFEGELYLVPGGDTGLPVTSDPQTGLFWNIVSTVVSPSPATYQNLDVNNVTSENIFVLNTTESIAVYSSTITFNQALANILDAEGWHTVGAAGEPAYGAGWSGNLRFRMDYFGVVYIDGNAVATSGESAMFILPAKYRPDRDMNLPITSVNGSSTTFTPALLTVAAADGSVQPTRIVLYNYTYFCNTVYRKS